MVSPHQLGELVDVPQDDVVGGGFDYQGVPVEAFDEVVPGRVLGVYLLTDEVARFLGV